MCPLPPLFLFFYFYFLPSCGLLELFLGYHFELFIVLLSVSLCIVVIVVALGIMICQMAYHNLLVWKAESSPLSNEKKNLYLNPQNLYMHYLTWQKGFENVIKLRILRWEYHIVLPRWTYNHKDSYQREAESHRKEYGDRSRNQRVRDLKMLCCFEDGGRCHEPKNAIVSGNFVYCVRSLWVLIKSLILVGCHLVSHADHSLPF